MRPPKPRRTTPFKRSVSSKVQCGMTDDEKRRSERYKRELAEMRAHKKAQEKERIAKLKANIKGARSRISRSKPSPAFLRARSSNLTSAAEDGSVDGVVVVKRELFAASKPAASAAKAEDGAAGGSAKATAPSAEESKDKRVARKKKPRSPGSRKSASEMRKYMKFCRKKFASKNKARGFEIVLSPQQATPKSPGAVVAPGSAASINKENWQTSEESTSNDAKQTDKKEADRGAATARLRVRMDKMREYCRGIMGDETFDRVYKYLKQVRELDSEPEDCEATLKGMLKTSKAWSCLKNINAILYCEVAINSE